MIHFASLGRGLLAAAGVVAAAWCAFGATPQAPAFYPRRLTGGLVTPQSMALADFNRDGKLDLSVTGYLATEVTIFLGDGSGGMARAGS